VTEQAPEQAAEQAPEQAAEAAEQITGQLAGDGKGVPADGADYPQQWEADVVLADGGVAHVRPATPADGDEIRAMHGRVSARSLYLRYFSPVKHVSDAQVAVFTDVDHDTAIGLVVILGDDIIAAGTAHRNTLQGDPDSAEVAFLVEDSQQGRGLGSILLEHLAAAAQERGIRRFTAEVLGENTQMVRVFIDMGYTVHREYDSGVIDLVFDIAPTDKSRAVVLSREHRAEARSIARLVSPRSIAVIGASADRTKIGHAVLVNLLREDFAGPVYPVNPEAVSVRGVRAYPTVNDIPDPVDVAVVTVPTETVADVVEACRVKGVHGLVVMTGGFSDAGVDGAQAQRHMATVVRGAGMRLLGPNCLGLINTDPAVRLNASLAPVVPPPGRIGFFCQSGALGVAILADAAARGLGLSTFVSAGNRADVSGNDLLQYWYGDDRTEVVLLYLESFGNPRKFARLARVLARTKPVIAVKSGRHAPTVIGPDAADSILSDSILSDSTLSENVVATLFEQSGVIRTPGLTAAFDVAQLLSTQPVPKGNRIGIVGNSSALGVLAVDFCLGAGLLVAADSPVDLGVQVSARELADAVRAMAHRDDIDALVIGWVPPVATEGHEHAAALRDALRDAPVPVVTTFLAVDGLNAHLAVPDEHGHPARGSVPSYRTLERAVAALAFAVRYGGWLNRPAGTVPDLPGLDRKKAAAAARTAIEAMRGSDDPARAMTDAELVTLLGCYDISIEDFRAIGSADEAVAAAGEIGFPVALKSFDEMLRHRIDQAGIRLGLHTAEQVRHGYESLSAIAGPWLYVQREVPRSKSEVPTVFRITADPSFGALVSFGIGGMATELLDDRSYRAVPLTDNDAADLIAAPRAAPLLDGYRGAQVVPKEPLVDLALRLSALADDVPEVVELQLQPVLAGPSGIAITGAKGRIGPPSPVLDDRRRLR
jgi:acyl-CoA synthetase (NDP forming)/GNAT superfamily N-acetyltransferase